MRQPSNENPPVVRATDGLRESDPTETTLEIAPAATAGNPPLGSTPRRYAGRSPPGGAPGAGRVLVL